MNSITYIWSYLTVSYVDCLFVYHICMYIDDYMCIDDIIDMCLCMQIENSTWYLYNLWKGLLKVNW